MKFWDIIRIANRNLFRAKLRTSLTVLAIFVGAFTLVLTNAIGDGLREYIDKQVLNIDGGTVLMVRAKFDGEDKAKQNADKPTEYRATSETETEQLNADAQTISVAQMQKFVSDIPEIESMNPSYPFSAEYIGTPDGKKYVVEMGMLSRGFEPKLEAGKKFDGDGQIIIPLYIARAIDTNIANLIGKPLEIGYAVDDDDAVKTKLLKIVGVSTKGMRENRIAYVDLETAEEIFYEQTGKTPATAKFSSFTLQLNSAEPATLERVKAQLDKKGFAAMGIADLRKQAYDAVGILRIGLNLFALIALLAASFGIINTLIIAVMERTRIIGLQKALGMSRGKIFSLFSIESILIGFWGSLLGVLLGIIIGSIANWYLATAYLDSFEGYRLFVFTPVSIIEIIALVCVIAFLAGILPAIRASRLDPIEALRYE
ncbi:MAG: ABC transporter permease [Pyrinomonadaceae bacterium]